MRYKLEEDTKKIVRAIMNGEAKRSRRKRSGNSTEFDRRAEEATQKAKDMMRLPGFDNNTRKRVIDKICESLQYNTPWELLGETYCCRRLFYQYRKEYCYYVALNMGLIQKGSEINEKRR